MSRITKIKVREIFGLLCRTFEKRVAISSRDVGAWALDFNSTYGGWYIVEYAAGGGETLPMGPKRRSSGEFYETCQFAIAALTKKGCK